MSSFTLPWNDPNPDRIARIGSDYGSDWTVEDHRRQMERYHFQFQAPPKKEKTMCCFTRTVAVWRTVSAQTRSL